MKGRLLRIAVVVAVLALLGTGVRVLIGLSTSGRLEASRDAFEAEFGHRRLADLSPPPVPADENAATLISELVEEMRSETRRRLASDVRTFHALPVSEWGAPERVSAGELLDACGPWERFEELASRHRSSFGADYSDEWAMPIPPMPEIVGIAQCAFVSGSLALEEGDLERFVTASGALANLSAALYNEPTLVSQLVAYPVDRYRWHLLSRGTARGVLDRASLEMLLAIEERSAIRAGLAKGLQAEALAFAAVPSGVVLGTFGGEILPFHSAWIERVRVWLTLPYGDLMRLAALDGRRREILSLQGPLVDTLDAIERGTFYDPAHLRFDLVGPSIEGALIQAHAAEMSATLARAALTVALELATTNGAAPPGASNPVTGHALRMEATANGYVISAPEARSLIEERVRPTGSLPELIEWHVVRSATSEE